MPGPCLYGDPTRCTRLVSICYLTASSHYSSVALIPECNGLSHFKEDTGRSSVPVWEINLVAYPQLVPPTENHPDLYFNLGRCRSSASQAQQTLWLTKCISPLSHGDRLVTETCANNLLRVVSWKWNDVEFMTAQSQVWCHTWQPMCSIN